MFGIAAGEYGETLRRFALRFPRPAAIVIVSAHWEAPGPIRVNAAPGPDLIYDFGGFPPALYELTYPAPGSPAVAEEALTLLADAGLGAAREVRRGWDHGVWIPLRLLYPTADVSVVEVSLPLPRGPETVLRMGAALAPLRSHGVLLLGSGGIVHNLRLARLDRESGPVDQWGKDFDGWVRKKIERRDLHELAQYRILAPHADLAVPESEHFDPLLFAVGAAEKGDEMEEIASGFQYANLSLASYAFVPKGSE
ncbi:MAG: class III extradiol ring-cleavage dioxygenase [Acidobacteriota bacterium]